MYRTTEPDNIILKARTHTGAHAAACLAYQLSGLVTEVEFLCTVEHAGCDLRSDVRAAFACRELADVHLRLSRLYKRLERWVEP